MSEKQSSFECNVICWGIAAVVGLVSMVMLYMLAGFGGNQAFFTGALIGLVLGLVLSLFVCRGQTASADLASDEKPAQRYAREAAAEKARREGGSAAPAMAHAETPAGGTSGHTEAPAGGASDHAEAPATATTAAPAAVMGGAGVQPSASLPGEQELAARKGEWRYTGEGDAPGEVTKSKAVPAGETAAPAVAPDAETVAATSGETMTSADVEEKKPATLYTSAPTEGADDLKLISGVGPKLEQTLNELGIYRFAQVADWGPTDIAWVDNRLRFKGRIERDDWMSQARTLAAGGETEFSARKKK